MSDQIFDCAVIGGGPGGLTTAIYLHRYRRRAVVFDAGQSRAKLIPSSHNCPGFPGGVAGKEWLERLSRQAADFDVDPIDTRISSLTRNGDHFVLKDSQEKSWRARKVVLATGVVDVLPEVDWVFEAIHTGAIRLCAICDGYEASDKRIAVYGPLQGAIGHARFLRTFSHSVAVLASDGAAPDEDTQRIADAMGLEILAPSQNPHWEEGRCVFRFDGAADRDFDIVYPVLGSRAQSLLATELGAEVDDNLELVVTRDQMTSVPGLYAVGDIVSAINQISVAVGHAAIAATAIHNTLPVVFR